MRKRESTKICEYFKQKPNFAKTTKFYGTFTTPKVHYYTASSLSFAVKSDCNERDKTGRYLREVSGEVSICEQRERQPQQKESLGSSSKNQQAQQYKV